VTKKKEKRKLAFLPSQTVDRKFGHFEISREANGVLLQEKNKEKIKKSLMISCLRR
jgi:hypothetical protein